MKNWEVIKNGEVINIIVADDEFAAKYSKATGYELRYIEPVPEEPAPTTPTTEERITALEEANVALEDAICEMDAANEERLAAIEDALCEIDMG